MKKPKLPNPLPVKITHFDVHVEEVIQTHLTATWKGKTAGMVTLKTVRSRKPDIEFPAVTRETYFVVGYLTMLFVHEACRRHGVGRALVEECLKLAKLNDCKALSLTVSPNNSKVLPFYHRQGFQPTFHYDDGTLMLTKQIAEWKPAPPPAKS